VSLRTPLVIEHREAIDELGESCFEDLIRALVGESDRGCDSAERHLVSQRTVDRVESARG
jgi:hypothetical protein